MLSLACRFATLFAFLILPCVLAVAPWQFLEIPAISPLCLECASSPFLLSQGLQVPSSATSSARAPHPPLCTQPVFSIVLSTRSMGMCVHAWCILDIIEFADPGESLPSLLGWVCCRPTSSGSVCPWHLHPDPSNARQPSKVPDSTAVL